MKFKVKNYIIDAEVNQPMTLSLDLEHMSKPNDEAESGFFYEHIAVILDGGEIELIECEAA